MSARNLLLGLIGIIFALWMGLAPTLFGIGGETVWWYLPLITLPFVGLQLAVPRSIKIAEQRGRFVPRKVYVALVLSWVCAFGFGLTAPDKFQGEWVSVSSMFIGEGWVGMSIALCNPLGIIAFATVIAAWIFAHLAGRDPRPTEDDLLDAAEASATAMVEHPLK